MDEITSENMLQDALEITKEFKLSISLEGWPAAIVGISISASAVLIYAIKAYAAHV